MTDALAVLARRCDLRIVSAKKPARMTFHALRSLARRCDLRIVRAIALGLVLLGLVAPASAHALDIAYLRIEPAREGSMVVLDLDRTAAAMLLAVPALDAATLRARAGELAALTYARELPATPAGSCTLAAPDAELVGATVRLSTTLRCPAGATTWRFPFVGDTSISSAFELLVKETAADRLTVVDRHAPAITLAPPRASAPVAVAGTIGTPTILLGGLLVVLVLAPLALLVYRR